MFILNGLFVFGGLVGIGFRIVLWGLKIFNPYVRMGGLVVGSGGFILCVSCRAQK
jgi:hypothetical protein